MPFAAVRDLNIYYEVHGDGPKVLLISGTGGDLRADPKRAAHPLVRSGYTVLMYDQRGLGQTSKPDQPYSMSDYADDAAALLDHVGWATASVIGISFGGMVAQHVALRHEHRVERLVLACTSSGGAGGASFDLLSIQSLAPLQRLQTAWSIMDSRTDFSVTPPKIAPGLEELYPLAVRFAETQSADDSAEAVSRAAGALRQLEARAQHDTWNELPSVTLPTLVIGGRFDTQAPLENVQRLASRIPSSNYQIFDGGHLFLLQDPSAWSAVASFFGEDSR
jgi:3-oxoadipate enol-lactonase